MHFQFSLLTQSHTNSAHKSIPHMPKMEIITILILLFLHTFALGELRVGFYNSTCPKAEDIVLDVVQRTFNQDRSITGALLRLHFHDCFVKGCDASILIDSTKDTKSEKEAGPNKTVRGYELIDEAKRILEKTCPSTVSCADIITLATRDSVALAGGPRYTIATGRRDGLASKSSDVDLPGPDLPVSKVLQAFNAKGMNVREMVTLLGGHTVGFTHCSFVKGRLSDPNMESDLRAGLGKFCGGKNDTTVFLDQRTGFVFDNEFFSQMMKQRGVLTLDQNLALDPSTRGVVSEFAENATSFRESFVDAMVKLGRTGVLLGNQGEVRRNCRAFNKMRVE